MTEKIKSLYKANREFALYALIGIEGVVVEMAAFWFVLYPLGQDKLVANVAGWLLSNIHNFVLNAFFNFKTRDQLIKRFATYFVVTLVGLAISSTIILVGTDILKIHPLISKAISIVVVVLVQFFLNEKITFKGYKGI